MQWQVSKMVGGASLLRALCCLLMSGLMDATSLGGLKLPAERSIHIKAARAHDFLTSARPKRNVDPRWYRADPDFQSYYRFYSSIGHLEGLYEIDRIRMLYQQMRHLELTYGPDASSYQNVLGVQTTTAVPTTPTQPAPPPSTAAPTPSALEGAQRFYLCHPSDPLCRPHVVYLPSGALPVLCDPRINPACGPKTKAEIQPAAPPQPLPEAPAPKKSAPATPPATRMEYDCDPYWDPDCLIDHPPRLIQETAKPQENAEAREMPEEELKEVTEEDNTSHRPLVLPFDPYDFTRDLYDPLRYGGGSDPDSEQ